MYSGTKPNETKSWFRSV